MSSANICPVSGKLAANPSPLRKRGPRVKTEGVDAAILRRRMLNRAARAKYRARHPDRTKEIQRKWRERNRDRIRSENALSRALNPQEHRDKTRRSNSRHRQKRLEYQRRYVMANQEKVKAKNREWKRRNPLKVKAQWARCKHKRRTLLKNAGTDTYVCMAVGKIKTSKRMKCYYCGCDISNTIRTVEHITPISRGGDHSSANVCAVCMNCNVRKRHRTLNEWMPDSGQKLLNV